MKGNTEARMRRVSPRQFLAAILVAGTVIAVIVPILLGSAIEQSAIALPQLDARLGGLHLIAYTTHAPDCDGYVTPCQPEPMAAPAQDCYVIWVLTPTGQLAPADEWQTGTRLLTLPLRNQFISQ